MGLLRDDIFFDYSRIENGISAVNEDVLLTCRLCWGIVWEIRSLGAGIARRD